MIVYVIISACVFTYAFAGTVAAIVGSRLTSDEVLGTLIGFMWPLVLVILCMFRSATWTADRIENCRIVPKLPRMKVENE